MHADEIDELDAVDSRPAAAIPATVAGVKPYDPYRFDSWAEARKVYPYTALCQVIDFDARTWWIEPVFPMRVDPDFLEYQLEGLMIFAPSSTPRSAEEITAIVRELDPGPYPRR